MKSFFSRNAAKIAGAAVGLSGLTMALATRAAADADLVNASTTVATSIKENGMGVFYAALPIIIILPVAIFAFRMVKRLAFGR
jgi:hypothetical protein